MDLGVFSIDSVVFVGGALTLGGGGGKLASERSLAKSGR